MSDTTTQDQAGTLQTPIRIVGPPDGAPPADQETREARIRRALEAEAAEEAKVGPRNDHELMAGGSAAETPPAGAMDMTVVDGSPGSAPETGFARGEGYTLPAEGEDAAQVVEVQGYDARAASRAPVPGGVADRVVGSDDRVRIWDTTVYPWSSVCKLVITAADGSQWGGSGAFISPRIVLTAAHNLFLHDHGGWARQVQVIPGMNGAGTAPFGAVDCTIFHAAGGWVRDRSFNYDYGVVVLPPTHRLGTVVGTLGFASLPLHNLLFLNVNTAGYPGDKPYGTQWWTADRIMLVTDRRLYYPLDIMAGQSGSPVWRFQDGARHIVGVHDTEEAWPFNGAVRIVDAVFNNLVTAINMYP